MYKIITICLMAAFFNTFSMNEVTFEFIAKYQTPTSDIDSKVLSKSSGSFFSNTTPSLNNLENSHIITDMAFSKCGNFLVTISAPADSNNISYRIIVRWNLKTNECLNRTTLYGFPEKSLFFDFFKFQSNYHEIITDFPELKNIWFKTNTDGNIIALPNLEGNLHVIDLLSNSLKLQFTCAQTPNYITFSPDNQCIAWASTTLIKEISTSPDIENPKFLYKREVSILCVFMNTGIIKLFKHNSGPCTILRFNSKSNKLLNINNNHIFVFDLESKETLFEIRHKQYIKNGFFSADGKYIILLTDENLIEFWDSNTANFVESYKKENKKISTMAINYESNLFAIATENDEFYLYKLI